jgi:hypothetical protein
MSYLCGGQKAKKKRGFVICTGKKGLTYLLFKRTIMNDLRKEERSGDENVIMDIWGKEYLKFPRLLFGALLSPIEEDQRLAKLYAVLLYQCYYGDGYVMLSGEKVACARGEYVTSYELLTSLTGMTERSLRHLMKRLSNRKLVAVSRLRRGLRITLCGYDAYMRNTEKEKKPEEKPEQTFEEYMERYEEHLKRGILPGY